MTELENIRQRCRAYVANPYDVDAAADMAAHCDTDLPNVLAAYDALLATLDGLYQDMSDVAVQSSTYDRTKVWKIRLAAILRQHREGP